MIRDPRVIGFCLSLLTLAGCSSSDAKTSRAGGGTVKVIISGEDLGTDGLRFPTGSEVTIADGWELAFTHVLVTIGEVHLSSDPDRAPSDQSQTGGVVAQAEGPWAADLHVPGTVPAAGGEGTATPVVTLSSQNENGGDAFATDERYAFGYRSVAASPDAKKLNFDGDAETEALYRTMITEGYSVLYSGVATFKGKGCDASDAAYDFTKIPETVPFELGFAAPTEYLNCQNQDNQGDAFPDEEYERGIAVPANAAATAQITLHLDHAFYSAVQHEPTLYFDQIAAQAVGKPDGTVVTLKDLVGVDPTGFKDGEGTALPFRACDGSALPASKQMAFDVGSVPVNPSAKPADALRDYRDFITYVTSTQGHFNGGEGLCYVKRDFPSPP